MRFQDVIPGELLRRFLEKILPVQVQPKVFGLDSRLCGNDGGILFPRKRLSAWVSRNSHVNRRRCALVQAAERRRDRSFVAHH